MSATRTEDNDDVIDEMLATDGPVLADIRVNPTENCFPMIPAGAAHNEILLGPNGDAPQGRDADLTLA